MKSSRPFRGNVGRPLPSGHGPRRCFEYLDAAKATLGIRTDAELAVHLHLTTAALSAYRRRGTTFDPMTAVKIANILGIDDWRRLIAEAELERAERTQSAAARAFWSNVLGKVVAIVGAVGLAIAYPAEVGAAVRAAACVLCKIPRGWLHRLLSPVDHAAASLPSAAAFFCPARP